MPLIPPLADHFRRRFLWCLFSLWLVVAVVGGLLFHFYAIGAISVSGLRAWLIVLVVCIVLAVGYILNALRNGEKGVRLATAQSGDVGRRNGTGKSIKPIQVLLTVLIVILSLSLIYALWGLWEGRHGPIAARLAGIVMSSLTILFFAWALAKSRR
jgi:hypothetical protein